MALIIDMNGITKVYRIGSIDVSALKGIDLLVNKGEYVAVMGPSGSGKSTLMNLLGCLDVPTAGTYRLDGELVSQQSDDSLAAVRNRKIGFVFQKRPREMWRCRCSTQEKNRRSAIRPRPNRCDGWVWETG